MDHESVQATAVKIVFDLLLVFGFESFNLVAPGSSTKKERAPEEEEEERGDLANVRRHTHTHTLSHRER